MTPIVIPLCCIKSPPEEHGKILSWFNLPRRCDSCQWLNIPRHGRHDYTAPTYFRNTSRIKRIIGCGVLPHTYLMGSFVFICTHAGSKAQDDMSHLSRALRVGSLNRLLPSPTFLPFRLHSAYYLSLLTFCCHARIDFCKQHSRSVVHRHDPLVHVCLTACLTVCKMLLQNLTEPGRPSSIYGITLLQLYSYYNSHCSRDRWPLKSFVSVLH